MFGDRVAMEPLRCFHDCPIGFNLPGDRRSIGVIPWDRYRSVKEVTFVKLCGMWQIYRLGQPLHEPVSGG